MNIKKHILLPLALLLLSPLAQANPGTPDWVTQGWEQLDKHNNEAAFTIWQSGVNTLPDNHKLAFLGIHKQLSAALEQLNSTGRQHSAFIIRTSLIGSPVYHVLSAQSIPTDTASRKKNLEPLRQAAGISGKIHTNRASKFKPVVKNQTEITISPILWIRITFKSGQSELTESARKALSSAAKKLISQPGPPQQFIVHGYSDDEPIGGYQGKQKPAHEFASLMALSQARSDSVKKALINAGISSSNISADGFGAVNFIADNATAKGRNKNRRVDILLQATTR